MGLSGTGITAGTLITNISLTSLSATTTSASGTGNGVIPYTGSTTNFAVGMAVTGTNIPANSVITAITAGTSITINQSIQTAVASGTVLTIGGILLNQNTASAVSGSASLAVLNSASLATGYAGNITAGVGQQELFFHNVGGTLGIQSVITDNSTGPVSVVYSSVSGQTIEVFNTNTYTGTTYINSAVVNFRNPNGAAVPGDLVISGGANNAGDSLAYTSAVGRLSYNQQVGSLLSPSNVTVVGTALFDLNSYAETVNNLTLQQPGGSQSNIGAQVSTGVGALTVLGGIYSNGLVSTNGIPTINGFIDQTGAGGALTINVAAPAAQPNMIALALNATLQNTTSITKSGAGVLGIGGHSGSFTGTITITSGTLAISAAGADLGQGSAVVLNESATPTAFDMRGVSTATVGTATGSAFIGSLAGSGILTNYNPFSGSTLVTGLDNTNTTFTGKVINPFVGGLLSLTKVGSGTFNLAANSIAAGGNSANLGTLNIQVGTVSLSAAGQAAFSTTNIYSGGSLVLDSSIIANSNRLGGTFLLASAAVEAPQTLVGNTYSTTTLNVANATGVFAGMAVTGPGIASGTYVSSVLGSTVTLSTAATTSVAGGTFSFGQLRTLNLNGGNLSIIGNSSTAVSEATGTLGFVAGGSTITLSAAGTAGLGISAVSLSGQNGYSTGLILGDNLGASVGTAGAAYVSLTNAIAYPSTYGQSAGALGATSLSIRPDIVADTSSSGVGSGFLTQDLTTGLLRPLNASTELLSSTSSLNLLTRGYNVGLSSSSANQTIGGSIQINSLSLLSGGGLTAAPGTPSTDSVFLNAAGLLALSGNTGLSVPQLQSGGITMDLQVLGSSTTLNFNSSITNTTQGIVKAGAGTLIFNSPQYFTGANGTNGFVINQGTVQLNGGANTILAYTNGTGTTLQTLIMNQGTLDLNGNNQEFERLLSANPLPGGGGIITNTSGTTATLTLATGSATTFGGSINGNLNLLRVSTAVQTLSNPQGFTGVANLGGSVTLTDLGTMLTPSAINVSGNNASTPSSTLLLDNSGLYVNAVRLGAVPITLNGGKLSFKATTVQADTQSVGAITLGAGLATIDVSLYNNTASAGSGVLTIPSLTVNAGATLNFTSSGAGALGTPYSTNVSTGYTQGGYVAAPTSAPRIVITAAPTVTNGIIGGWATVNGTDWATYIAPNNPTYAGYGGVMALGTGSIPGYTYSANAIGAAGATDNVVVSGTTYGVTSRTINSLKLSVPSTCTDSIKS